MILKTTYNEIYTLTIHQIHKNEILLPKMILRFTWVSCEATSHTIPSDTLKRSFRLPTIRSFSLNTISYNMTFSSQRLSKNKLKYIKKRMSLLDLLKIDYVRYEETIPMSPSHHNYKTLNYYRQVVTHITCLLT